MALVAASGTGVEVASMIVGVLYTSASPRCPYTGPEVFREKQACARKTGRKSGSACGGSEADSLAFGILVPFRNFPGARGVAPSTITHSLSPTIQPSSFSCRPTDGEVNLLILRHVSSS